MLIRLENENLVEYPDEVGALALADPSEGDVPDYSLDELNLTVNGLLAVLYDEELTLEENIEQARENYTRWGIPNEDNMGKALALIKFYNENVAPTDIGYGPFELIKELYGIPSSKPKAEVYIVDNMPSPPKKLLTLNESTEEPSQKDGDNSSV